MGKGGGGVGNRSAPACMQHAPNTRPRTFDAVGLHGVVAGALQAANNLLDVNAAVGMRLRIEELPRDSVGEMDGGKRRDWFVSAIALPTTLW